MQFYPHKLTQLHICSYCTRSLPVTFLIHKIFPFQTGGKDVMLMETQPQKLLLSMWKSWIAVEVLCYLFDFTFSPFFFLIIFSSFSTVFRIPSSILFISFSFPSSLTALCCLDHVLEILSYLACLFQLLWSVHIQNKVHRLLWK